MPFRIREQRCRSTERENESRGQRSYTDIQSDSRLIASTKIIRDSRDKDAAQHSGVDLWSAIFSSQCIRVFRWQEELLVARIGSINQESIRRHFILDPRSRRLTPLLLTAIHTHTPTHFLALTRSHLFSFFLSFSRCRFLLLSLPSAILGDLYGQYRGGISTIGRTRVMLVADTTWLLVSK